MTSTPHHAPAAGRSFVVGISGGSGAGYALRLLEVLAAADARVMVVISDAGCRVLRHEAGLALATPVRAADLVRAELVANLEIFDNAAVESTPASGSAAIDGVVVCPCSMGTLARIAHGFSSNLIERAADVALKEGRRLVVVPRETPLSRIHLRNMLALVEAGGVVLPAMPGFYLRPRRIEDLIDFIVARILDKLEVAHELVARWQTPDDRPAPSPWDEGER